MRKIALISFVFLFTLVHSQEVVKPRELFDDGQYFFVRKDYKEALYFFLKLVETSSTNANFNFKVGECYLNIPGQEHFGVPYFEKAIKKVVPKRQYRPKDFKERNAPLHAYFYLGNTYRMAGELDAALKVYNKFIDSPYFHGNYNISVVENEMKSCERAKIIQDSPIELSQVIISSGISTSYSEYNPVISSDGSKIVFVRGLKFYDAVFISLLQNGEWTKPVNISPEIGSDGDFYPTGMNSDGTAILFIREVDGTSDIYISRFNGKIWGKAKKIPGKVNSMASETFASFGMEDKTLYFVSDRQKGRGGKDIWVSELETDGLWGKPKNMGKEINTKADEESPVMCRNNKTLFFSSRGHYNMGGYDIFYTNKSGNEWSIPKNLGYPINTTRDDLFYSTLTDCKSGLYSIIDLKSGVSDIFLVEIKTSLAIPE